MSSKLYCPGCGHNHLKKWQQFKTVYECTVCKLIWEIWPITNEVELEACTPARLYGYVSRGKRVES